MIPKRRTTNLLLVLVLLLLFPNLSWARSGKVVSVADVDTITVLRDKKQVRIRLYGIDRSERGQAVHL